MKKKAVIAVAIISVMCSVAYAVTLGPVRFENYLASLSAAAQDAAVRVTAPPDLELDAAELRLFQLGVAYGYDYAENGEKTDNETTNTGTPGGDSSSGAQVKMTPAPQTYVLNKSSKKFHRPDCDSVRIMKEKNKEIFTGNRQELINQGYSPCQNCNP